MRAIFFVPKTSTIELHSNLLRDSMLDKRKRLRNRSIAGPYFNN